MRSGTLICVLAFALMGCPGGDGAIGEPCADHGDCASTLQCVSNVCVPRCQRAPDCGDGYRCDSSGLCHAATGQPGDRCKSEVDCSAGLSCQIEDNAIDTDGFLQASCVSENSGRPAGATCQLGLECRNGTCDLGHCIDLCSSDLDCGTGTLCTEIPRVASGGVPYRGCLQARGAVSWSIPITGTNADVLLPIPSSARSVSVLFTVDDVNQKVGAARITAPDNTSLLYPGGPDYYQNMHVRHRLEFGQSVLALPVSPVSPLQKGTYKLNVVSRKPGVIMDVPGSATPTMTAVVKVDDGAILDLHFYFLNFDDHPCSARFGGKLDAQVAQSAAFFRDDFIGKLNDIFSAGGVVLGNKTYHDLREHPDLDGLAAENAAALLSLGTHSTGVNVFFVRTLSPIGLQAIAPNPGPAGLGGTRQSGIVISLDTLCYRDWRQVARLTAHELARYMGLFNNVEIDPAHVDPLPDTDESPANLMFYSELGGEELTQDQRAILRRSAVLR